MLVMAPTRELAIQTHETLEQLGEPFGIASVAVYGGVDKGPQIKALKNMNQGKKVTRIVVGTPGRILDLANEGACDLSRCVARYSSGRRGLRMVVGCHIWYWTRRTGCSTRVSRTISAISLVARCRARTGKRSCVSARPSLGVRL